MKLILSLVLGLVSFLNLGCGSTFLDGKIGSNEVSASELYLTLALKDFENGTVECYARLSDRDQMGMSVELIGKDSITCNGVPLGHHESFGEYVYYSKKILAQAGDPVRVQLNYGGSVYTAENQLALPVQILNPQGFSLRWNESLVAQWIPINDPNATTHVELSVLIPDLENPPSTLSYKVSATQKPEKGQVMLSPLSHQIENPPTGLTPAEVIFSRTNKGRVDSRLDGHFDGAAVKTRITGTLN